MVQTVNYSFNKPLIGSDKDSWGDDYGGGNPLTDPSPGLNGNWEKADQLFKQHRDDIDKKVDGEDGEVGPTLTIKGAGSTLIFDNTNIVNNKLVQQVIGTGDVTLDRYNDDNSLNGRLMYAESGGAGTDGYFNVRFYHMGVIAGRFDAPDDSAVDNETLMTRRKADARYHQLGNITVADDAIPVVTLEGPNEQYRMLGGNDGRLYFQKYDATPETEDFVTIGRIEDTVDPLAQTDNTLMTRIKADRRYQRSDGEVLVGPFQIDGVDAITHNHGLGYTPKTWRMFLRCTETNLGYAVDDVVDVTSNNEGNGSRICSAWANDASIGISGLDFYMAHKTTGALTAILKANWRIFIYYEEAPLPFS